MAEKQTHSNLSGLVVDRLIDYSVTLICWVYFIPGFLFFFAPVYIAAYLFSSDRERSFQRLHSKFYRGLFLILRAITPRIRWEFDADIPKIRSSLVVCNHLSYLDPILLISLLDRSKTIVKTIFFRMPVFGWLIRTSGYFPATGEGEFSEMLVEQVETMNDYLARGGNLFVFPEGTRSRDGKVGSLNSGAFKIARLCRAPIYVLRLKNTDKLFTPGHFFFNTRKITTISVKIIDCIEPDRQNSSLSDLANRIRDAFIVQNE